MPNRKKRRIWLKDLIHANNHTYESLAEWMAVSRGTINNWIAGENIPTNQASRLADIFNCSIDYIITGEREKIIPLNRDLRSRWIRVFDYIGDEELNDLLKYLEKTHLQ